MNSVHLFCKTMLESMCLIFSEEFMGVEWRGGEEGREWERYVK